MKATDDKNVFQRGKHGIHYVRRRIPRELLAAYPPRKSEIVRSLQTSDPREARSKAIFALAAIEAEFRAKRSEIDLSRASEHSMSVRSLTDEQLARIGDFWSQQVLLTDARRREGGLDDEEFEALGADLQAQRSELARMLAQGRTGPILPALRSFLHLCGISFNPAPDEAAHAASTFLRAVVRTPGEVTPLLMTAFVDGVRSPERSLAVSTTNGHLSKVKEIYKIACGKHLLTTNPATNTLGARQNAAARRRRKRLPFSTADLDLIFRSRIFTAQHRSHGQSGEASYWLRILMYYSGVRPQELAGLELSDLRHDPHHGW